MTCRGPELSSLEFSMYTPQEIRDLSVVEIKTPLSFNALGHALKDGLYDPIMGPAGFKSDPCGTCNAGVRQCPGHFGHIELPLPVVNPLHHKAIATLLRLACTNCFKLQLPGRVKYVLKMQLTLLEAGNVIEAEEVEKLASGLATEQDEKLEEEVIEAIVKECVDNYMKNLDKVEVTPKEEKTASTKVEFIPKEEKTSSTKVAESLRNQFINNAVKQIIKAKSCPYCKAVVKKITSYQNKLLTSVSKVEVASKFKEKDTEVKSTSETKIIMPEESKQMMRKVWLEEESLLREMFPILKQTNFEYPTDAFYIDVVFVPPPKTRPLNFVNNQIVEHSQTGNYKAILQSCIILKNIIKAVQSTEEDLTEESKEVIKDIRGSTATEKLHNSWMQLQADVDHLLDIDMSKTTESKNLEGLKQIIEKKEGVLRMHMMGKRVNFAARTVITPDPNLNIDEIGIPEVFAKKLTYPIPVTYYNVEELRRMVKNGPDVYPGATIVENENGSLIRLEGGKANEKRREGISKLLLKSVRQDRKGGKIVHRHLVNGDILLLNRQPTLHKPSIMAHCARILKNEKTLRMHYSNCKSYNADFDGDEMNAHCPQSEVARSEAYNIVNVSNQYLVPKDGTPLGGLIQDHMISGVRLTVRGQFFSKEDYYQLVYQALSHVSGNLKLLPPTILKPKQLWSGKQIISTILLNIIPKDKEPLSINSYSKINDKSWEKTQARPWNTGTMFKKSNQMSESEVIIKNGHLLCGVLDKQHYGATQYSLTHCMYELYGGACSTKLLNSLAKLFTYFLQLEGFTIGVEDILVLKKPDRKRKKIIRELRQIGDDAASKALNLTEIPNDLQQRLEKEYFKEGIRFRAILDRQYKSSLDSYTNNINKTCLPTGLIQKFPENNLQLMVTSGAKGSTVNTMQISCLLGQIELEGKRPPWMISGRSLPSFIPFETTPRAGGFVDGRFMTGIRPQEFFFHCMAGREGLIDTAVKTSRSGYLQRCLIKHLEGVMVNYDMTVRDTDGSVIQFAYGEDGRDVCRAKFLKKEHVDFLYDNRYSIINKNIIKSLKESTDMKGIKRLKNEINDWNLQNENQTMRSPFSMFSETIKSKISEQYFKKLGKAPGRLQATEKIIKKWRKLDPYTKEEYEKQFSRRPDPVASVFKQDRDYGALTESLEGIINQYLEEKFNADRFSKKESSALSKSVKEMISFKSMTSLAQPGEPVGLLAAQSVGEPSTQMTLNTFHFAGRGEMNVTLGIPRLREILMTASKDIKTPSMDIPFKKVKNLEKKAKKLIKSFQRVTVAEVLEKVSVKEALELMPFRQYTYTVRFDFLPYECYKDEFRVKPKQILQVMEKQFLIVLSQEIRKLGKKYGDLIISGKEEKQAPENEGELDEKDATGIDTGLVAKKKGFGETHESSDEDEQQDDEDATQARFRNRHSEAQEYEEPNDSEVESSEDEDAKSVHEEEEDITPEDLISIEARQNKVINTFSIVKDYRYDIHQEEWCEIILGLPLNLHKIDISSMLREICRKVVIYEIPNIKRAILFKKSEDWILKTEGINFDALVAHDKLLDLSKLYSNDVHKVAETYGIEAAGRVIVKEIKDVFNVYGITVDPRHLLLIADYMTFEGAYLPFNRTGMEDSPSPLQQISFESAISFLRNAVLRGRTDALRSASSRIIVGRPCLTGTGCFDLLTDFRYLQSANAC